MCFRSSAYCGPDCCGSSSCSELLWVGSESPSRWLVVEILLLDIPEGCKWRGFILEREEYLLSGQVS